MDKTNNNFDSLYIVLSVIKRWWSETFCNWHFKKNHSCFSLSQGNKIITVHFRTTKEWSICICETNFPAILLFMQELWFFFPHCHLKCIFCPLVVTSFFPSFETFEITPSFSVNSKNKTGSYFVSKIVLTYFEKKIVPVIEKFFYISLEQFILNSERSEEFLEQNTF